MTAEATADPNLLATDLADRLVLGGVPFRQAHEIVGKLVGLAAKRGVPLHQLEESEYLEASPVLKPAVIASTFNVATGLAARQAPGAPSAKECDEAAGDAGRSVSHEQERVFRLAGSRQRNPLRHPVFAGLSRARGHPIAARRRDSGWWPGARPAAVVAPRTPEGEIYSHSSGTRGGASGALGIPRRPGGRWGERILDPRDGLA